MSDKLVANSNISHYRIHKKTWGGMGEAYLMSGAS
jgi:hypothetical protein